MELQFVTKSAFAVMGIEGSGLSQQAPNWIKPLWAEAYRHRNETHASFIGPAWGLMSGPDRFLERWKETGRYLAGWEVTPDTDVHEPWKLWRIPTATYAAVECALKTYCEVMAYGDKALAVHPDYEVAGAIHEYYPNTFKNPETDSLFLYFTVRTR
jgi:hypothetical protein